MKFLKQIFCTKIGWAFLCWILFTVSIYLETPEWVQWLLITYPVGLVLIATIYGIKNMLADRKDGFR